MFGIYLDLNLVHDLLLEELATLPSLRNPDWVTIIFNLKCCMCHLICVGKCF